MSGRHMRALVACSLALVACVAAQSDPAEDDGDEEQGGAGGRPDAGAGGQGRGGVAGSADAGAGGGRGGAPAMAEPQTCVPPADRSSPPAKLSATGCVDPTSPKRPAPSLLPFEVASPLWSDGADKRRWLALPPGGKLRVDGDGHLEVPPGSVLVKSFLVDGKLVETRLFVRFADGEFGGYSYVWDEAETDADVIPSYFEARERALVRQGGRMQTWYFPSRRDCLTCHTEAAGYTLGPELAQLDFPITYPDGARENQLQRLAALGLLERADLPAVRVLPTPVNPASGTLEARARAYLHTNCGICHRPGGEMDTIDVRFGTPLSSAGICDVEPLRPGFPSDTRLLLPGNPGKSVLSLRMHATDAKRMPQIASSVVDQEGVALIDAWIASLTRCP